jgi:hypothetical protein
MAKQMSISHHAPHHHPHIHQHPHSHGAGKHPVAKQNNGGLVTGLLCSAAVCAAVLWYFFAPPRVDDEQVADTLLNQMQSAVTGTVPAIHAYGGALNLVVKDGRMLVIAFALPTKACVQAGWRLSKQGIIIVNGVLPPRLSAARLAELCSMVEGGATLTWVPEQQPAPDPQ